MKSTVQKTISNDQVHTQQVINHIVSRHSAVADLIENTSDIPREIEKVE